MGPAIQQFLVHIEFNVFDRVGPVNNVTGPVNPLV
jgi:hypothetical protein